MPGKVLVIALACYPSNSAGSHRPVKTARHLPEFGWDPVILCAEWTTANARERYDPGLAREEDPCRTIRMPYPAPPCGRLGRAARRFLTEAFPYTTPRFAVRSFLAEASRLVESEGVDVIWSTYKPGLTHLVASRISMLTGVPWVADFRNLPDEIHDSPRIRRSVRYEVSACTSAAAITTVCQALAVRLKSRHEAPVHIVTNGFDPEDYDPAAGLPGEVFDITYCGTLYEHFDPRPLFRAIDLLESRGDIDLGRVAVGFYGPPQAQIDKLAAGFQCARVVRAGARVPYKEMLRRQQESAVLLVVKPPTSGGAIPSKVYEYLGARRPVLCVPGDGGEVDEILAETGAGVSVGDPEEIADVLGRWFMAWSDSGVLPCGSAPERLKRYSRRQQTRGLAVLFDSLNPGGAAGVGPGSGKERAG
jgi:glycosyltransferase involved in cell wall biosynthesis